MSCRGLEGPKTASRGEAGRMRYLFLFIIFCKELILVSLGDLGMRAFVIYLSHTYSIVIYQVLLHSQTLAR
jgi:hypothetical protein